MKNNLPPTLRQFSLFDGLSDTERSYLNSKLRLRSLLKGERLLLPASTAPLLYLIHQGQIKLSRYSDDGREVILDFRQPGDVIGELALLGWTQPCDMAEVTENSRISTLSIHELQSILTENCLFRAQITQLVVERLKRMQYRYESLCFQGAGSRIRQFIRDQADTIGHRIGSEIDIRMTFTHQDIANLTITSRQVVTSVLRELKRQNVITYNRSRILIRDYQALVA